MNASREQYSEGTLLLLILIVTAAFFLANLPIADRSVWVDEAMLLSNFWDKSALKFFEPLPYYDQSAPPLPTLLLNIAVKNLGTNITATRYFIVIIVLISIIHTVVTTVRFYGLYCASVLVLISVGTWQLLFYSSEIKHYGFEIAGSFLITAWIIQRFGKHRTDLNCWDVCLLLIGLALGFSTLFPFLCALLLAIVSFVSDRNNRSHADLKTGFYLLLLLGCGIAYKFVIDYYSQFQIQSNFDVYATNLSLRNLKRLFRLADPLVIVAAVMGSAHLIYKLNNMQKMSISAIMDDSKLPVIFFGVISMGMVGLASILGLYPAIASRQLVWLIPVAIVIIAIVASDYLSAKKSIRVVITLLLSFTIGLNIAHSTNHLLNFKELDANNALYTTLNQQQPSTVLLHFGAQPSFDIYRDIIPGLQKHRYLGRYNRENGALIEQSEFNANYASYIETTPGAYSSMVYFRKNKNFDIYSDWAANLNKDTPIFYVVFFSL